MTDPAEGRLADVRSLPARERRPQPRTRSGSLPLPIGHAGNLPFPVSTFIGRSAELAQAADLLADHRLLTFTGSGGCGKTRLAIELARLVQDQFADGTWFVDLGPVRAGEHVLTEVAAVLGVVEPERGKTLAQAIASHLSPGRHLVVLDNCEHVSGAVSSAATAMLQRAAGLRILATSREPLSIPGEVTWRVPELNEADAVALFAERARQARPGTELAAGQAAVIRKICRRLDGLPLAVELAAARARALSLTRIAATLEQHLDLLSAGPGGPSRHSTLRASFEWSLDLLPGRDRDLLAQLAAFAGGFGLDSAIAVCDAADVVRLAGLADRNLLRQRGCGGGTPSTT
jgi:predicted ATPase